MTTKTIVLIAIDLVFVIMLIAVVFKDFKNFKKSIYYLIYPDIASIIKKDYDNDFAYTHKLLLVLALLFLTILIEVKLFY